MHILWGVYNHPRIYRIVHNKGIFTNDHMITFTKLRVLQANNPMMIEGAAQMVCTLPMIVLLHDAKQSANYYTNA